MKKPKYEVPLMSEISKVPKNNYKLISTFSGCGGSCLGFKMAGFTTLWANEFVRAARDTYEANHPEVIVSRQDIRDVTGQQILNTIGLKQGEIDVLEGSPPCADFSMAGKRAGGIDTVEMKGWGRLKKYSDRKQQVDDLFFEFARILKELQPKVFVAENVKGLTTGHTAELLGSPQLGMFGQHEDTIYYTLSNCGYNVRYKVLNAKSYGVPQNRERLIFIGTRLDLKTEPVYPIPLNYIVTVREAWDGLENKPEDITPMLIKDSLVVYEYLTKAQPGEPLSKYHPKGSFFTHIRLHPDKISPTILASQGTAGGLYHSTEHRSLTLPELKRLHSLPDDFILTGKPDQQCERIGRSVPPLMMYHIAKSVQEILDRCKIQ